MLPHPSNIDDELIDWCAKNNINVEFIKPAHSDSFLKLSYTDDKGEIFYGLAYSLYDGIEDIYNGICEKYGRTAKTKIGDLDIT